MDFNLHIKNIGKLDDAKIRIGQFTVFAGPNNTGKSFISKVLYSFFEAMNADPVKVYTLSLTRPLRGRISRLIRWKQVEDGGQSDFSPLIAEIQKLERVGMPVTDDIGALQTVSDDLVGITSKAEAAFNAIRVSLHDKKHRALGHPPEAIEEGLEEIEEALTYLKNGMENANPEKIIASGIKLRVEQNLLHNFQIPLLADLRGSEKAEAIVDVGNFAKFKFSDGEIEFDVDYSRLWKLQQYSRVVYLESPAYWKLKNVLEFAGSDSPHFRIERERLNGVPKYFNDLANALKYEYTGEVPFPDVYERLTRDVMGGKIVLSENGNLLFRENGRSFSLSVTALGVANFGILALLIERKVLDKGTFLFIDEPEAHLHTAGQVVMAEALFELAKGGVNVVIATHSAEILKRLEVHVKENPDDENLIALNQFSADGVKTNDGDFDEQMAAIKQELTKPFSDLYLRGLLS